MGYLEAAPEFGEKCNMTQTKLLQGVALGTVVASKYVYLIIFDAHKYATPALLKGGRG